MKRINQMAHFLSALLLVAIVGCASAYGQDSEVGPAKAFRAMPSYEMLVFVDMDRFVNEAIPSVTGHDRKMLEEFRSSISELEKVSGVQLSAVKYVVIGGEMNMADPASSQGLVVVQGDFSRFDLAGLLSKAEGEGKTEDNNNAERIGE